MKQILRLLTGCALIAVHTGSAQLIITPGSYIKSDTSAFVVLNDVGITSQTTEVQFDNVFKFAGSEDVTLNGYNRIRFNKIILEKQGNAKVLLDQDVEIDRSIFFSGGLLELNNREIHLQPEAVLLNENKSSRITGTHGGFVSIEANAGSSLATNPGNLGAILSSSEAIGRISIKRGHKMQSGFSMDESIERYYDIESANKDLDRVIVRFNYFDAELNGQDAEIIRVYQSQDRGIHWNTQQNVVQNAGRDIELKGKAHSPTRLTLAVPGGFTDQKLSLSKATLQVWPNPASNYFYVQVDGSEGDAQVQVFDINGKLHRSYNAAQGTAVRIEGLLPGIYIIKAESKNLSKANRVIVQNTGGNQTPTLLKAPSKKL